MDIGKNRELYLVMVIGILNPYLSSNPNRIIYIYIYIYIFIYFYLFIYIYLLIFELTYTIITYSLFTAQYI